MKPNLEFVTQSSLPFVAISDYAERREQQPFVCRLRKEFKCHLFSLLNAAMLPQHPASALLTFAFKIFEQTAHQNINNGTKSKYAEASKKMPTLDLFAQSTSE